MNFCDRYFGQNTSRQDANNTVFFGLNSVLDFRLAIGGPSNSALRDVVEGFGTPDGLFRRLDAQRNRALNRGEIGRYLITLVDNHDGFWQIICSSGPPAPIRPLGDWLSSVLAWNYMYLLRD